MKFLVRTMLGILALIALIALVVFASLGFFTLVEYRPGPVESVAFKSFAEPVRLHEKLAVVTFNIGYGALGKDQDFFMDGGKDIIPKNVEITRTNISGAAEILKREHADFYFIQEVDLDAKRSYEIDQFEFFQEELGMPGAFAYNMNTFFVPYPIPPLGHTESGIANLSKRKTVSAERVSLPGAFKWPVSTCNFKRCMLVTRAPVEGTNKELVLVSFHLDAFDDGEGKKAQSKAVKDFLAAELAKGNYVVAGGDFNQTFEGMEKYPVINREIWMPGHITQNEIPERFSFAVADNAPTCRVANEPYNPRTAQVYVLDGFLVSDNVRVKSVRNLDAGFTYSDHNPVRLEFSLTP